MIKLSKYIQENPKEEEVIANIFNKTGCYDYINQHTQIDYEKDARTFSYTLKEHLFYYKDLYLLKEEDNYILFSISENIYKDEHWVYSKTREQIKKSKKIIILESIYSFTQNQGFATKNIFRLKKIAECMKAEIIVDTYTPELIHLSLKYGLNILKESSLTEYRQYQD